jgi:hypothetical protein
MDWQELIQRRRYFLETEKYLECFHFRLMRQLAHRRLNRLSRQRLMMGRVRHHLVRRQ